MAVFKITPRFVRGRLFYQVADCLFPSFRQGPVCAWSAADAHRLDIIGGGAL